MVAKKCLMSKHCFYSVCYNMYTKSKKAPTAGGVLVGGPLMPLKWHSLRLFLKTILNKGSPSPSGVIEGIKSRVWQKRHEQRAVLAPISLFTVGV